MQKKPVIQYPNETASVSVSLKRGAQISRKDVIRLLNFLSIELKVVLADISVSIVSRKILLEINKKFLQHNYETDIITFSYGNSKKRLEGELLISFEDAVENANKYSVEIKNEFIRLIVHGILHLNGYSDADAKSKKTMFKLQETLIKKFI